MKRPAKKNNKGLLGAVGAVVLGVAAGAAAVFLSKKENRDKLGSAVRTAVKKGKVEATKAKKKVIVAKKKILKRVK